MKIGILAVQGAFAEHRKILEYLGAECKELRQRADLTNLDGIILPGGESTVQGKLLKELDMFDTLRKMIQDGMPTLATCAGLILLADELEGDSVKHLGTLPVTVKRNAYGRQLGSFEKTAPIEGIGDYPMVFIRAPYIERTGPGVQVLSEIDHHIVAVKYENQIGLSFHPELTKDTRIHEAFLKLH